MPDLFPSECAGLGIDPSLPDMFPLHRRIAAITATARTSTVVRSVVIFMSRYIVWLAAEAAGDEQHQSRKIPRRE
jgi:hypothetical protein